jgi:hypothetical protein
VKLILSGHFLTQRGTWLQIVGGLDDNTSPYYNSDIMPFRGSGICQIAIGRISSLVDLLRITCLEARKTFI